MPGFGIGPNLANYGSRGRSPSLVAFGQNEQDQADQQLGSAAASESKRNAQNTIQAAQAKQGNEELGGTLGSLAGYGLGSAIGAGSGALLAAGTGAASAAAVGAVGAGAGAAAGAGWGSVAGPFGAIIGGVLGAVAGKFL